jgi:hypothetical protein
MVAYDTTNTAIHLKDTNKQTIVHTKDTVITIPIDNSPHDILSIILKFLPYTLTVIVSMIVLWLTLRHNGKTTMKQIEVATHRKLIDDLIEIISEIDNSWAIMATHTKTLQDNGNFKIVDENDNIKLDKHTLDSILLIGNKYVLIANYMIKLVWIMPNDHKYNINVMFFQQRLYYSLTHYVDLFINYKNYDITDIKIDERMEKMYYIIKIRLNRLYKLIQEIVDYERAEISKKIYY